MGLPMGTYPSRRFYRWLSHAGWLIFFLAMRTVVTPTIAQRLLPGNETVQKETGICQSVDIRNTLETFKLLEGCRVVEGFVQILLFENINETLYNNISFPELVEITDYLLLYRVNGLRTLGQLFPNLAVIRGQNSFFNYAFVLFEMSSLQEIGLYSLTDITHGLVRIDKNPNLCFVNTIEWDSIAHEKGEHFIKSNKLENECPICPNDDSHSATPNISSCSTNSRKLSVGLCWNQEHCQKLCPKECGGSCINSKCCDRTCLGGCSGEKYNNCTVCRNFSMGALGTRQCMEKCPADYYQYLGRRCVTKEECKRMKRPITQHYNKITSDYPYKPFQGECRLHCPAGYMEDTENQTCKHCKGRCKKECDGVSVDSLQSARQLRGCTHIRGSLEIQIRGGRNIVNELEENLNMIEEIQGYLKIVRSFPLVSLNFLRNLKVIRGENLDNAKHVFVLLDNQNLQELWDWDSFDKGRTLQIKRGKLFFHFNPKLCFYKILRLKEEAKLGDFTDSEVATNSNGDKVACNVTTMIVEIVELKSTGVVLKWQQFSMEDPRSLLGYVLYSIEAPHRNITLYDGRDACGGDGWRVDDVENPSDNAPVYQPLTLLKPYTQYAFYVKTYTIATERSGAQSPIYYFRTKPDMPSVPLNVQVFSYSSDSLMIKWQPPALPNGNITHYIISGIQQTYDEQMLNRRNYCNEPLTVAPIEPKVPDVQVPEATTMKSISENTCSCEDNTLNSNSGKYKENEVVSQINFEDELHNQVYIKREDGRRKRDLGSVPTRIFPSSNFTNASPNAPKLIENKTSIDNVWVSFTFKVSGRTDYVISNLRHFTMYNIYIQACRDSEMDDTQANCSAQGLNSEKTAKKADADNLKAIQVSVQVSNHSLGMVHLSWAEPKDPNGLILTYSIEYRRMDIQNSKALVECIKRQDFVAQGKTYTLKRLNSGNYSLRVMATSLAGNGAYTEYSYFFIDESGNNTKIALIVCICIVVVIFLLAFVFLVYRRYQPPVQNMKLITTVNPEYVSTVYVPDDWEVPRKKIDLLRELGQGSFGMVYEGVAHDIKGKAEIRCAIKTVNEHATDRERIEFLNEASVMKAFDTTHVVRLLGVVSQGQPTLVVMELMANGDLKSYLRSHRPEAESYDPSTSRQPPTLKRILQMAIEIADGMAYLAAKKFVHRDLAARNCMVADDLTVKIGDFGMTRDIYETDYYRKGTKGLLPVRWMAPESLKDGVFTSSSDVWSYGVVLWEMATLASQPYQGLSNDQVLRYVIDGGIMERPENCPDKLYTLMRYCWQHKPLSRPSFLDLASHLLDDANVAFQHLSFYHSPAGIEARSSFTATSQDDPRTPLRLAHDIGEDFSLGSSDPDSDSDMELDSDTVREDTRIEFPCFQPNKDDSSTANGYVSGRPTNGTATTQC